MNTNELAELKVRFETWLASLSRGKQQTHFPTFLEIVKSAKEASEKERNSTRTN